MAKMNDSHPNYLDMMILMSAEKIKNRVARNSMRNEVHLNRKGLLWKQKSRCIPRFG